MKRIIAVFTLFFISVFLPLLAETKGYEGPFVSTLRGGKFKNSNFCAVSFGKVSVLKKKKLVKSGEEILLRISKKGSEKTDIVKLKNGEYFLLQSTEGRFVIKDIFFKKKYYKVGKSFSVYKSNLSYLGNIKIILRLSNLDEYSYTTNIDTRFRKLNFGYNRIIRNLIDKNTPSGFIDKTEGKIMVPVYIPAGKIEHTDQFDALKATMNNDVVSLKKFLKKENDLNKIWDNGQTLLMTAFEYKNKDIAEFILNLNPDIKIKTNNGWTALIFSLRYGMKDMAKKLINRGADVRTKISNGWNALFLALRNGCDEELLNMMIERGCNVNTPKDDKWTPLMMALVYQDENICDLLYKNGADINVRDDENWTPLMYAIRYDKHKLAEKIIENDSDINASNVSKWTPLLFALRYEARKCAKLLVKKGADIFVANRDRNTPLHFALEYKFPDIAKKIIMTGKGISKMTRYGWTPLMVALRYSQPDAATLLLKKGVSMEGETKDGWTTLHLSVRYDQPENAITIIKRKKVDMNSVTNKGWTALLLALRYNYPEVAKELINSKADVNIPNASGWTPLMMALEYDQPQLAKMIIKKGADKGAKNSAGRNALDIAKSKGYFNFYKLLEDQTSLLKTPKQTIFSKRYSSLSGLLKDIIPSGKNPKVIKHDNCTSDSSLCSAELEYNSPKKEIYNYIIRELKKRGFKYDKGVTARTNSGSLKNKNIWGVVNFTRNTSSKVVIFTVFIYSDHKTGRTKTVASFVLSRMPKKMNLKFPKIIK